jgi:hypothetical protein
MKTRGVMQMLLVQDRPNRFKGIFINPYLPIEEDWY